MCLLVCQRGAAAIWTESPDYVAASCESGQRCHRLNNLASTNSLHTWRVLSSCPLWKSSQIHEFVQLCQKQIETGRVPEQLQSEAPFLKI